MIRANRHRHLARATNLRCMTAGPEQSAAHVEQRLLRSLSADGSTVPALAERTGLAPDVVLAGLRQLLQAGLVEGSEDGARLTPAGLAAAGLPTAENSNVPAPTTAAAQSATVDLDDVARAIGGAWSAAAERRAARAAEAEALRDALLASDADRDEASRQLTDAFAHGRLTRTEFEDRTARALRARTHGELDDALHGLGGLQHERPNHPVRKVVFWVLATMTAPFVLVGGVLAAFGTDWGDHLGGLFILVLFLPGLFALRRWAWPKHQPRTRT